MKTANEILNVLEVKEVLVKSDNYLQIVDVNNNFREFQKDYRKQLWYEFKTIGNSENPTEIFINFVN